MRTPLIPITITLALALAACGNDAPSANETAPEATTETTLAPNTSAPPPATEPTNPPITEPPATNPEAAPAEPVERLRIHHPETLAFAAPFIFLDGSGALADYADAVDVDVWASPDVMRSLVVAGDTDITAVPTYVAANLFSRGVDIHLAAVSAWGLLWLVGPDGTPADWEQLRGQTVLMPFPNDMPDLVFQRLAIANGLTPGADFTIEHFAQPPEVVGRLLSGGGSFAVLPEHLATVALARAGEAGVDLGRMMDLQSEWAAMTGFEPRIPQVGVIVRGELARQRPDVLAAFLDDLEQAIERVNTAGPADLAMLAEFSGLPEPVVAEVIPRLNLRLVAAGDARNELERFFTELAELSPDIIGGALPDPALYLDDPR